MAQAENMAVPSAGLKTVHAHEPLFVGIIRSYTYRVYTRFYEFRSTSIEKVQKDRERNISRRVAKKKASSSLLDTAANSSSLTSLVLYHFD
jgi:endonuclease III-like uncharacterized protein